MRAIYLVLFFILSSFSQVKDHIPINREMKAGYLSLSRERAIDHTSYLYIKYALESFRKEQVAFVLLDLDTPGGEVFSALQIVEELRKMDADYQIPVIALVDNWAISAGALLAYSCRFIGANALSSMGAAEPVMISSDGKMETASEKMVSALRVEFAKVAKFYGRNPLIAEAMVDKDVVIVMRQGKITQLLQNEDILASDQIINSQGKLLTLSGERMHDLGLTTFFSLEGQAPLSGQSFIEKQPLFTSSQIKWIPYSNWKISFFAFLSHPFVSSLLMIGLMMGLYATIQSQTLGLSSCLGCFCLSLILLSTFSTQIVGFLELIFFLVGILLFAIDLFFLGWFFIGGLGLLLALGGVLAMLLPSLEGTSFSLNAGDFIFSEWLYRLSLFLCSILFAFLLSVFLSRFLLKKGLFARKLVLTNSSKGEETEASLPQKGDKGKAFTAFRPFGKVEVCGKIYEAESEGEFIGQGANVEVIGVLGHFLIVREL